jgi:hypothetical protein
VRTWTRTRWAIAVFIAVGVLVALVLIVRDLGDDDVPEETGTLPGAQLAALPASASTSR